MNLNYLNCAMISPPLFPILPLLSKFTSLSYLPFYPSLSPPLLLPVASLQLWFQMYSFPISHAPNSLHPLSPVFTSSSPVSPINLPCSSLSYVTFTFPLPSLCAPLPLPYSLNYPISLHPFPSPFRSQQPFYPLWPPLPSPLTSPDLRCHQHCPPFWLILFTHTPYLPSHLLNPPLLSSLLSQLTPYLPFPLTSWLFLHELSHLFCNIFTSNSKGDRDGKE